MYYEPYIPEPDPKRTQSFFEKHHLGNFQCPSGKLILSDPAYRYYEQELCHMGNPMEAKPGTWEVYIDVGEFEGWGRRLYNLYVCHNSLPELPTLDNQIDDQTVGVDSASMCIFDLDKYKQIHRRYEQGWEQRMKLLGPPHSTNEDLYQAKLEEHGVSCWSGLGDGTYPWFVERNEAGLVVAVRVRFIDVNED